MADDREVLREVWEGRLPICFNLSSDEVVSVEQPEPCYLLVPRMSYFPLVTDKVFRHFQRASSQDNMDEMWLEFLGQPLKWHYPIGVLYDIYGSQTALPWNITVHLRKFPEQDLLRCHGRDAVEAIFMSSVKEADSLKHKSAVINAMRKNEHKQLWNGLCSDRFDQFWSVNKRLMERLNGEPFRYTPIRVMQMYRPMTQKLFKSVTDSGDLTTFGDFLRCHFPHLFAVSVSNPAQSPNSSDISSEWTVMVQGISPPLETPLQWMSEHLSHPDNFLYLILQQTG